MAGKSALPASASENAARCANGRFDGPRRSIPDGKPVTAKGRKCHFSGFSERQVCPTHQSLRDNDQCLLRSNSSSNVARARVEFGAYE
jgi:hypothetical protein